MSYEEQATNWVDEHRERFFNLHAESDHVETVSNYYSDDCYDIADEFMIDDSDLLLVVGSDTKCYGAWYAESEKIKVEKLAIKEYLVDY